MLGIALQAIRANKLRSGLTLIGITFGMLSVMTIISALEGMKDSMEKEIGRLGQQTFMVSKVMVVTSEEMWFEKIITVGGTSVTFDKPFPEKMARPRRGSPFFPRAKYPDKNRTSPASVFFRIPHSSSWRK